MARVVRALVVLAAQLAGDGHAMASAAGVGGFVVEESGHARGHAKRGCRFRRDPSRRSSSKLPNSPRPIISVGLLLVS